MCNGIPFTVEKILPQAGLKLGTSCSVGQRLTHRAIRDPNVIKDGKQMVMDVFFFFFFFCKYGGTTWCTYIH